MRIAFRFEHLWLSAAYPRDFWSVALATVINALLCWSAEGSRSVLPWALAVIPGSPDTYVSRCACESVEVVPDSVDEASAVACSMVCVCVDRVDMQAPRASEYVQDRVACCLGMLRVCL